MKLWGGRFRGERDPRFDKFSESFSFDSRLIEFDLRANRAYVRALGRAKILTPAEAKRLIRGLDSLGRFVERNPHWASNFSSEDVHTWVEDRLGRIAGAVARKLRTGRSRNDLVATDLRLYVQRAASELERAALDLMRALVAQAESHRTAILPGYTHLQPAQPILFAHYLLAYFSMLERDVARIEDARRRADELPLGAGALAGTPYPVDRVALAKELGFARVAHNSLDVTSDRDFVCEMAFAATLAATHLSRLAEDLILYSTPALGFVEMDDAYATGSSLMPQKKNADALELIRGKAARIQGRLAGLLALMKGLPLAYNRDLQEDKPALFDALDTARDCLELAAAVVGTLNINEERMRKATHDGFLTATDIADELVLRGIPFAEAHEQTGKLVRYCLDRKQTLDGLGDREARALVPHWDQKLRAIALNPEHSVARRQSLGGTAPGRVAAEIVRAKRVISALTRRLKL